jgi:pSer/pThr/pTyr-binding forkhead associated (FHA) protein
MPKIQLTTSDGTSLEFDISSSVSRIGRAEDNDFVIPDGSVSSHHGEISSRGEVIEIVDLGSTNGTFVRGERERVQTATIHPGESFRLGTVDVLVAGPPPAHAHVPASEEAEATAQPEIADDGSAQELGTPWSPPPANLAPSGLSATPCPTNLRKGFGPKPKAKSSASTLFMLIGILALLACGAAVFMINGMGGS